MTTTMETHSLFEQVFEAAGAVILAFSPEGRICLANRAATDLLGQSQEALAARTAAEVGLERLPEGPPLDIISLPFTGPDRRWIVSRTNFEHSGISFVVAVLSEASEALRAEERNACQKIIRVLGHEINNSLAPIMSIARTLGRISSTVELPKAVDENLKEGLEVIGDRAESLNRFLQNYARLSKLPPPARKPVDLEGVIRRVCSLEHQLAVQVVPGPKVNVNVDSDQLEQALINVIRNGVESVLMNPGAEVAPNAVSVTWAVNGEDLKIWVRDLGIGLSDTENIFVPFYRTKPTGSGIGLLLTRHILEAHGGSLRLQNRTDTTGCEVQASIPKCVHPAPAS